MKRTPANDAIATEKPKARYVRDPLRIMLADALYDRNLRVVADEYGWKPSTLRAMVNGTRLFSRDIAMTLADRLSLPKQHIDVLLRMHRR